MERKQWLEQRRAGIAVSDMSAILGLNPFKSPIQVYMDKLGMTEESEDTLPMKLGRRLEPVVGELFTERTGLAITPGQIIQHPTHELILGTPDFLVINEPAGLEAKTTAWASESEWGEEMTDMVPMLYLVQCLGYIEVTQRDLWYLAVLIGGNRDFRIYRINRDDEAQKRLVEMAERFWREHIEKQIPPPLDATKSSAAYLKRAFPRHAIEEIIPASAEAEKLIGEYATKKASLDVLETECDTLRNQICAQIGDAAGMACERYRITWKASKDSERTEWKAVAAALNPPPELVKQHTTVTPGARRFLLKENK